jgi:hypothetical protein
MALGPQLGEKCIDARRASAPDLQFVSIGVEF